MSAECGTLSGYYLHVRRKEPRCQPCKDAMAAESRRRTRERRSWVKVDRVLLAELFLNAPIFLQERLEGELGRKKVDEMVEVFDKGAG
jgi:hypothetical protein